jgi:hypothetical protein
MLIYKQESSNWQMIKYDTHWQENIEAGEM